MEGNGNKCEFGQNCKNKALNTLRNCSKLTINHLRYLKSNWKELEIAENYLILNRAGINVITSQHLNRHICEQHRDELGIYWTRKNRTCAHPLHGDSKATLNRGIDAVMSSEIWLRLQLVVVAIWEGNLQNHTSYICIRSPDINTTIFIFTRWTFILPAPRPYRLFDPIRDHSDPQPEVMAHRILCWWAITKS